MESVLITLMFFIFVLIVIIAIALISSVASRPTHDSKPVQPDNPGSPDVPNDPDFKNLHISEREKAEHFKKTYALQKARQDNLYTTAYGNQYSFTKRSSVMTAAEQKFFRRLENIFPAPNHIFPQIHLSSLFDHRVEGQSYQFALKTIIGKSVDYVITDAEFNTRIVIELDDKSHDRWDRR